MLLHPRISSHSVEDSVRDNSPSLYPLLGLDFMLHVEKNQNMSMPPSVPFPAYDFILQIETEQQMAR